MNAVWRHPRRLIIDLPSDLNPNNLHSEFCPEDLDCPAFFNIPVALYYFPAPLSRCLQELTNANSDASKLLKWFSSPEKLAARKTIRTVYVALDQLRRYITAKPCQEGNYAVAEILFNAILEMSGLPCLSINFASERWVEYTQMALKGDLEPLMVVVLNELIQSLTRSSVIS